MISDAPKTRRNKYIILRRWYSGGRVKCCNIQDLAAFYLSYSGGLDRCYRPSKSTPPPQIFPLCFFWLFILVPIHFGFSFLPKTMYLSISHSLYLYFIHFRDPKPQLSLSLALTLPHKPKIPPKHYLSLKPYLSLSLSLTLPHRPKIPIHVVSAT